MSISKIKVGNTEHELNASTSDKLNTDAGSVTQPIYFKDGVPVNTTYTLGASVPSDAKFTDTTYENATTSTAGLMSPEDKAKLDGVGGQAVGGVASISYNGSVYKSAEFPCVLSWGNAISASPRFSNESTTITLSKDSSGNICVGSSSNGEYVSFAVNGTLFAINQYSPIDFNYTYKVFSD